MTMKPRLSPDTLSRGIETGELYRALDTRLNRTRSQVECTRHVCQSPAWLIPVTAARLPVSFDEPLVDDGDIHEFTPLQSLNLFAHRFEVALHAVDANRHAVDEQE